MIKILPKMSSQRLEVKERLFQGGGAGGPAGGGGRASHLRTDLKRRSSEIIMTETAEKAKRIRRPSEGGGGGGWKHHRRVSRKKQLQRKRALTLTNNAPFNSTQFLMSDHGGDTIQYLDSTLNVSKGGGSERVVTSSERRHDVTSRRVTRARESSFSLDSDEDFYYSSPEDEEEFVSQEFMKEYNRMKECVRTDRLSDMSKADLIQEYLQMEQRVDSLEKRLNRHKTGGAGDEHGTDSSSCSDSKETAEQIRLFQREILRLESENERLRSANVVLLQQKKTTGNDVKDDDDDVRDQDGNSSCSTCSSSSSESESGSDSDSSDSEEDDEQELFALPAKAVGDVISGLEKAVDVTSGLEKAAAENDKDDTGYESSHSGSITKQPTASVTDNSASEGIIKSTIEIQTVSSSSK